MAKSATKHEVGLFVTCLVDLFRPSVAYAAVKLLENNGCKVSVPMTQTCCGQPAYNSGGRAAARGIARRVVDAFEGFDYVVAPSGSCAAMIRVHYPDLLGDDPDFGARARALAERSYELVSFLADVLRVKEVRASYTGVCTYHDGCSGLRELGVKAQPRKLLKSVSGLELRELRDGEACCGFGGVFCVKYPDISNHMVTDKTADIRATRADTVLSGEMGCLLNIAGKLSREGTPVRAVHVAEVLAGTGKNPAIGETEA